VLVTTPQFVPGVQVHTGPHVITYLMTRNSRVWLIIYTRVIGYMDFETYLTGNRLLSNIGLSIVLSKPELVDVYLRRSFLVRSINEMFNRRIR